MTNAPVITPEQLTDIRNAVTKLFDQRNEIASLYAFHGLALAALDMIADGHPDPAGLARALTGHLQNEEPTP